MDEIVQGAMPKRKPVHITVSLKSPGISIWKEAGGTDNIRIGDDLDKKHNLFQWGNFLIPTVGEDVRSVGILLGNLGTLIEKKGVRWCHKNGGYF